MNKSMISTPESTEECQPTLPLSAFQVYARVPAAVWATRCVAYPMGAYLAYFGNKLRLTPNMVSLMAMTVSIGSAVAAGALRENRLAGGLILLFGLQLGYALDCADGVLARTTGRCSNFGAVLDKTLDALGIALIPGVLCIGAFHHRDLAPEWLGPAILLAAVPRVGISIVIWLKDLVRHGGSKTQVDERRHTPVWWVSRAVIGFLDAPVFSLIAAVTWSLQLFVEFITCYGVFNLLALSLYLWKSKRELDA